MSNKEIENENPVPSCALQKTKSNGKGESLIQDYFIFYCGVPKDPRLIGRGAFKIIETATCVSEISISYKGWLQRYKRK